MMTMWTALVLLWAQLFPFPGPGVAPAAPSGPELISQAHTQTNSSTSTCTITVPSGGWPSGSFIYGLAMSQFSTITIDSITDTGSNSYTISSHGVISSGNLAAGVRFWSVLGTTLNAGHTIVATYSASDFGARKCFAVAWSGIATSSPNDGSNTGVDTSFPTSDAMTTNGVTTSNANNLITMGCMANGTFTWTPHADYTSILSINDHTRALFAGYRIVSATGTYTGTATLSSAGYWYCWGDAWKAE